MSMGAIGRAGAPGRAYLRDQRYAGLFFVSTRPEPLHTAARNREVTHRGAAFVILPRFPLTFLTKFAHENWWGTAFNKLDFSSPERNAVCAQTEGSFTAVYPPA